ncbi:TonB-dependent receptor plug domain-containing protein [Flagellimonas sp. CMM7]|uniref:TonB-dependent receptor plug domain-containing protein n=1 Tax=Flagellimonas sp. CMM7 TaxID=2654676 RepID=UPI001F4244C6|nr:TonB-dependent receptor plug domain-containing protein [Flagellimonas sp. CMM7]UII80411.1 TonB-dependent receptor [Flagellimonas sp. CMM7]
MKTEYSIGFRHSIIGTVKNKSLAIAVLLTMMFHGQSTAQEPKADLLIDSILPVHLEEVIVISSYNKTLEHKSHHKPLSTLDEYLESSKKVNMIKRGAYAWEPVLNDMSSERLSVTIDGMRIFGACTDKMDPITSYVDVSNLSDVHVASGQQGAEQGATIGGAIDLRLEKSNFTPKGWVGSIETGGETNNEAQIIGGELNYSDEAFYVDTDIIYRKAENYTAGGGEEVAFSQFEKYNISANAGYKVSDDQQILASFIYDEARDVGYPALPMDVSLARAFIGSISWKQSSFIGDLKNWETKLYANSITHIMDDSQRPDVPIRMDMPGWSDTYGYYSQAELTLNRHKFLMKVDGFYNRSLAEMTMYPNNPNEREMFMLTWPDVRTINSGFYAEDEISLKESSLKLSTRLAVQGFNVADEFGLNSLRIFYPEMRQRQTRFLKSVSAAYHKKFKTLHINGGLSYGDRAPSVSEGFGFYLFNSFDNHDYIGDPDLKNEKAIETNVKVSLPLKKINIGLEANYFHTMDFIIGEVNPDLSVMTIGAQGVKVYRNLEYANLYNISLDTKYEVTPEFLWTGLISYHRGTDQDGRNLPFISPIAYNSMVQYTTGSFSGSLTMRGAADQVNFNPIFGEDRSNAYTVFSMALGKSFPVNNDTVYVKAGVENIFDEFYSTYTDWNNIPRMGRNFFMTVSYAIN